MYGDFHVDLAQQGLVGNTETPQKAVKTKHHDPK